MKGRHILYILYETPEWPTRTSTAQVVGAIEVVMDLRIKLKDVLFGIFHSDALTKSHACHSKPVNRSKDFDQKQILSFISTASHSHLVIFPHLILLS